MRIPNFLLPALLLLTGIPLAAAGPDGIDPEVLQAREAAWRAWFGGDEATLRALLPEDFLAIGAGESRISDRETTIGESRAFHAGGGKLLTLAFPETRAQRFGDTVILYGSYEATYVSGDKETKMQGRLTEVFVRREGRWVHPGWHLDLR